jgi:serine phosphatase RsbU (regulator of sigma subunit)
VNEAMNSAGDFFGDDRLVDILRDSDGLDAAGVCDRIVSRVNEFAGTESLSDDLTIVVVRRT